MEAIDVSPEMLTLVGIGALGEHRWPTSPVAFEFDFGSPVTCRFHESPTIRAFDQGDDEQRLIFIIAREACERLFGGPLLLEDDATHFLPAELRVMALAIRDCAFAPATALPYRLAKSIEMMCELMSALGAGRLAPAGVGANLSQLDLQRITAARQLIDDQWHEKLTLDQIARSCGVNRSKLSRGFRDLYHCTVSEALSERRLAEARRQLIATDLPVSLIGYRNGYLNNAAFTRAFGRRFGQSPTDFRACGVAA
jgi:AraC family transcriptional activator of pyochelin receptor